MLVFTRNFSGVVVGNEVALLPRLRKTPGDFEIFYASAGRDRREYAYLRPNLVIDAQEESPALLVKPTAGRTRGCQGQPYRATAALGKWVACASTKCREAKYSPVKILKAVEVDAVVYGRLL
jgi:hypothetical protein